jgi:GT2 family glycosyltransferase
MSKKNFQLSVIIVSYNSEKYINSCLSSLKNQSYKNFEIIIIDNNSSDKTLKYIEQTLGEDKYLLLKQKENLGFATGNNIGIKYSNGKYICLLNPDVILEKDYINNAVEFFKNNDKVGSVSGKIFKYRFRTNKIEKTNIIDTKGLELRKNHQVVEIDANKKDIIFKKNKIEIFGVSAAAGIYRRDALEDIKEVSLKNNYFDDTFFIYKEDVDLAFRLRHAGWKSYYLGDAVAYHDRWETGSSKKIIKIFKKRKEKKSIVNYYSYRNHLLMILKNQYLSNIIWYSPFIVWYEFKKIIYFILFEQKTLLGLFSFIKLIPLTLRKRNAILSKSKLKPSDLRRWF